MMDRLPPLPLWCFAVAFAVYAVMAAPGVEWMDSGELTAAGFTLGGAHPPGHPAHTLLAKLASLVPIGEVAFRVNLLSALCMAAAVAGTAALARALVAKVPVAAAVAAGVVALSPLATTNATRAEVYAPVAALLVWALERTVRFVRDGAAPDALVAALCCALAAAFHPLIALAGALPIALGVAVRARRRLLRLAAPCVALGALALIAYGYLPVRGNAAERPLLLWDDPSDLDGFMRLLGGGAYQGNFALEGLPKRAALMAMLTGEGTGLAALFAGLVGLAFAATTRLRGAWLPLAFAASVIVAAATQRHYNPDMPGYVLPALLALAAGVAPLISVARKLAPGNHWLVPYVAAVPILGLAALGPVVRADDGGARRTDDALRHWDDTVGRVPAGPALYFANTDHALFPAQYEQLVAGARPDVALASFDLAHDVWFLRYIDDSLPALYVPHIDDDAYDAPAERLVATNLRAGRYVGGEVPAFGELRGSHAAPRGLGWRYALQPIDSDARESIPAPPPRYAGGVGRRVAGLTALVRARWEAGRGRLYHAARAAGLEDRFGPSTEKLRAPTDRPELARHVPVTTAVFLFDDWQRELLGDDLAWRGGLARERLPAGAVPERRLLALWHALLDGDPGATDGLQYLSRDELLATARAFGLARKFPASEEPLRVLLARDPDDVAAIILLGSAAGNQGRFDDAARLFTRATELAPRHADGFFRLGLALQRLGRIDEARAAFARARLLDPRIKTPF